MKIADVQIHNYRSIADQTIRIGGYSLLIGANNSGKSNVIDALRVFYEKDLKFDFDRDFPKFATGDKESWIEIEYTLSDAETKTIKTEYLEGGNRFRVRKWLHPQDKVKAGLVGYKEAKLSEGECFYGWKNVGQGKLGNVIYIPAISRLEEHTKLTGPSALRELINDVLRPIIADSPSFAMLKTSFEEFSKKIKAEETPDKRSLAGLEAQINAELEGWRAQFNLEVVSPQEDHIIKNLIRHSVEDGELKKLMEPESFGHGFQRHLIYTLVRVSASYTAPKPEPKKKEFSPELELILFEEPEAFLHPPQQDVLDSSLRQIAVKEGRQVLAATHSPLFVSRNADDIADLVRLCKQGPQTEVCQISREKLKEIFETNQAITDIVNTAKDDSIDDRAFQNELEAARYFLWLNPERCSLFFANRVLVIEGLCEQVLIDNLIKEGKIALGHSGAFVLEVLGKYNVHRFMNLLGELKIGLPP